MENKRCICFLVSNEPRDFYITFPVLHYIEQQMGYNVEYQFTWDAIILYKDPPDLVLMPNARGHNMYFEISRYCYQLGIQHFILDSEGNFIPDKNYDFWGYNIDKQFYYDLHLTWSERIRQFLIANYPISEDQIKVSGATGFDKYHFLKYPKPKEVLSRFGKNAYRHVIGYAGWAFGKQFTDQLPFLLNIIKKDEQWLEEQRLLLESILRQAIEDYPEVLFILKKHPRENFESDTRDSRNEMNPLKDYPNVLYLHTEEEIQNLIAISDLWLSFESTSAMEAWILNTPTAFINPDPNFQRSLIYQGCQILSDYSELKNAIEEVVIKGNTKALAPDDVLIRREKIINDSIGYSDGLNHLRAGKAIKEALETMDIPRKKKSISAYFLRLYILLHIGKCFYNRKLFMMLPKFKKNVWVFEERKLEKVKQKYKESSLLLREFYKRKGINPGNF